MVGLREQFEREINQADKELNLARAALLFAQYLGQQFDLAAYLQQLDSMAAHLQTTIDLQQPPPIILENFNHHIFADVGLNGNQADYYNPFNSLLNQVIEQRTGIPISLGVLYLELGWRLELPMRGIGLPGHFVVAYGAEYDPVYVDVFHQKVLNEDECGEVARVPKAQWLYYRQRYLHPMSKKEILYRMLLNLKHVYVGLQDWEQSYLTLDLMVLLGLQKTDLRDRGLLAKILGRYHEAIFDLKRYLFLTPQSKERKQLEAVIEGMEEYLLLIN